MTQPFDRSMYGAVDLSGLAQQPADTQAPADNATVPGPFVVDVTAANLRDVLERSARVAVILLFSTQRVPEAAQLDQTFREVAAGAGGRFQLGRVDTDTQPQVAQALGIQGVPAAVAIMQGRPFPLFEGVPEAAQIRPLIDQVIQAAAQAGITGVMSGDEEPQEAPLPPHMQEAYDALEAGDTEAARAAFELALKANPGLEEAKVGLAHVELAQRAKGADATEILVAAKDAPLSDIETHMRAADIEVLHGRADAAFARLIDVIKVTSGDERDTVRKRLLELFEVVGNDPIVNQARRALASALF
ncbi:tetratricopeptide repeat protein [Arcanobacterium haemolyticum]|nr:tetratricopeptide repeat protein [Arcanobacterium haemolyticum]